MTQYQYRPVRFYKIKPLNILLAILLFVAVVACSILLSTLFGGSLGQFSFTEDFSFSVGGTSALMTILLASVKELFFEKEHIGNLLNYSERK